MIYFKAQLKNGRNCLILGLSEQDLVLFNFVFTDFLNIFNDMYESLTSLKNIIKKLENKSIENFEYFIVFRTFMEKLLLIYLLESLQPYDLSGCYLDVGVINSFTSTLIIIPIWYKNDFNDLKKVKNLKYQINLFFKTFKNSKFSQTFLISFFRWLIEEQFLKLETKIKSPLEYILKTYFTDLIKENKIKRQINLLFFVSNKRTKTLKKIQQIIPRITKKSVLESLKSNLMSFNEICNEMKIKDKYDKIWISFKLKELINDGVVSSKLRDEKEFWMLKNSRFNRV